MSHEKLDALIIIIRMLFHYQQKYLSICANVVVLNSNHFVLIYNLEKVMSQHMFNFNRLYSVVVLFIGKT